MAFEILFQQRNLGECVVGSDVLIPKPITSWSPLAKLIFKFKLFSMGNPNCVVGECAFVVRKKAARFEDKRLLVVDVDP